MSQPEFRQDPLTRAWVGMVPGRRGIGGMRPAGLPEPSVRCPFCPGHESDTEASTFEVGVPWRVRSVRNRFPIVRDDLESMPLPPSLAAEGLHEVIIESRAHDKDLATMTPDEAHDILLAWRDRTRALASAPKAESVLLFRNKGRRAGSSQPHPHAQVVALPFVPPNVALRQLVLKDDAEVFQRTLEAERRGQGVVIDADGIVTYCPFASPRGFWARVVVDAPIKRFAEVPDAMLPRLASRVRDAVRRALQVSGATDYNILVMDPPLDAQRGYFTIEIVPRTGGDAGFELASGTSLCIVLPEVAAAQMRAC